MGLWVIVLVAAVGSLIYQKFDSPTIQSVTAANLSLEGKALVLNNQLNSSRSEIDSLRSQLSNFFDEKTSLLNLLSRSSGELNYVLSRIESVEKEGERLMKIVDRFVTVVPLKLPPHDLRLTPAGP